MRTRMENNMMR